MTNDTNSNMNNNEVFLDENGLPVETQYVDEFGNPIDPSLIDENGNYIGQTVTQYVDEFGNPIDPSLIDESGNYIGEPQLVDESGNPISSGLQTTVDQNQLAQSLHEAGTSDNSEMVVNVETAPLSAAAHQMDNKELITGMVTFDYNNVPITDIVNSIILDSINKGASDIHFDPFDDGIKIRLRVDGQLNDYSIVPLYVKKNMITRIKIISGMNITESRTPQDGAIRTELQNKTIDLRVSCLPTNMGEKIVIRIMDYSMSAQGIDALDFSEKNLKKIKKMLALPNGIILVTGATGSGKSTTVYSMLQKLNVEGTNLVTVEDPIEMNIGGINQVQAVAEIGLTFATVLRSILRQDPDVIMIGEIRDDETARIAVRASITGHLVLSTIHTNNSLSTIERLLDMSVERYLLGSSLSGVVSQKLSRRLCEKCKRLRPTTEYEKETFKKALNKDIDEIYEPVGCPECSRGYRGRIAIHEVLLLNQSIKDAITKGVQKDALRNLVYSNNGTDTMLQDGLEKVVEGKTSFEEILKLVDLEDDLGSGTQLGLDEQISASNMNMNTTQEATIQQPININLSPDMFANANFQMPPVNFGPSNGTPMYIPYPVQVEDESEEEEQEIVIKPIKKKKKKTIVEIDPEEFVQYIDNENDINEKIEVIEKEDKIKEENKSEEIIKEINQSDEINEIENEKEHEKIIENEEIIEPKTKTSKENKVESEIESEKLATIESKKKLKYLIDDVNNLLNKLHSIKRIATKKKFNIKVQEIIENIEPLYLEIKDLDNKYLFNEATEKNIKDLLDGIVLNFTILKKDEKLGLYNKTTKRIDEILNSISKNQDIETIKLKSNLTDKELDAILNTKSTFDKTMALLEDVINNSEVSNEIEEMIPIDLNKKSDIKINENNTEIEILDDKESMIPLNIKKKNKIQISDTKNLTFKEFALDKSNDEVDEIIKEIEDGILHDDIIDNLANELKKLDN